MDASKSNFQNNFKVVSPLVHYSHDYLKNPVVFMHQSDSSNSECKRSHVRTSMTAVNHHVCAHPPARPSDSFSSSSLHSNSSDICSPKRLVETADTNNTPRKGEVQQNHQLSALCGFGVCVLLCCGCTAAQSDIC